MRRWIVLLGAAGMVSCAAERGSAARSVDEAGAIEVARREVQARETWAGRATYSASRIEDGWAVFVVRIGDRGSDPDSPVLREPNRMLIIDLQGKLLSYSWGQQSGR